jgi:hypothetical protein
MSDRQKVVVVEPQVEQEARPMETASDLAIGQWFWVKETHGWDDGPHKKGDTYEWLGCVMHVGSNYVKLESQGNNGASHAVRVHFDNFWTRLRPEPDAEAVIRAKAEAAQERVNALMDKVRELTQRLGVVPQEQIAHQGDGSGALALVSSQADTKAYKVALLKAKDEDLPALFKKIETEHKTLVSWMTAGALPAKAQANAMKSVVGTIEDRLFTVSLYAGLTEEAVQCSEGEPAGAGEPLRIMQRRLYMDEECLLSYIPGGIKITDIGQFDRWIALPENRDRLLPFPRTLTAIRVRHREAEREGGVSFHQMMVDVQLRDADKTTFLYVRNGEQVWRIDCDFVFGAMIFPVGTGVGIEPTMISYKWSKAEFMPVREYEDRLAESIEKERLAEEWNAAHPDQKNNSFHNPHQRYSNFNPKDWVPFDASSVYHDDGNATLADEAKKHNRLAVIVQGLYDRSMVLHPHPPVQLWEPHSFERAVTLVRDGEALADGEEPDFEAYLRDLNATIGVGSIVTGQEDVWLRHEADKENERQRRDWRNKNPTNYTRFRPYANPGPGLIAEVSDWKPRSRKATFHWERETQHWRRGGNTTAPCSIRVPDTLLLNVAAYKPGDFKRFLADHRTREKYLQWAPLMLAAEDYHGGKLEIGKPRNPHG